MFSPKIPIGKQGKSVFLFFLLPSSHYAAISLPVVANVFKSGEQRHQECTVHRSHNTFEPGLFYSKYFTKRLHSLQLIMMTSLIFSVGHHHPCILWLLKVTAWVKFLKKQTNVKVKLSTTQISNNSQDSHSGTIRNRFGIANTRFSSGCSVLQAWKRCKVSISSVTSTRGNRDEGTPRSSTHWIPAEMKLINSTSYLNGFTVKVDVQSILASGGRAIGRECVREIEWVCHGRITVPHMIV